MDQQMKTQWSLHFCFLIVATGSIHGSLVKTNLGLKVKRGQSSFLQKGDLEFHIPRERDNCKLEVILNEPITQRVGKLQPQVFDCHYLTDEVKYVHNGCPLLTEDTVKFRLYRFTETDTYTETFYLHVKILEPDCNIIDLGPKNMEVPEFYGLSNVLDGNVMSFNYERRTNLECNIQIITLDTHLPVHGQLVTGEPDKLEARGDEPESFVPLLRQLDNKARAKCKSEHCLKGLKLVKITKMPCEDFLLMGLRYQHIDPPSPDVDYIAIRLDLVDTRSRNVYQSEHAWIPVQIISGITNQPPKPNFMSMLTLEVDQFILTPFSTTTLDAVDEETPKQRLVFNITKPPKEGFITHLSDHTRSISSFTWVDLNEMLIGYQPPNSSHIQRRNYEVEFEAQDFYFEKSTPIKVHISVQTANTNAPRVSWNMGLSLLEGQSRPITWDQLQIVDNDNPKAVHLITVDGLQHGRLTVRGGKGFMFSISEIKEGVVRYHHDDSDTNKDFVIFRITDGHHQTRHKFPINILPKDDSPPFLITNMVLELSEGQTALLRGSILQASDMDSSDDYILFNITRPPQAGEIMKIPGPGIAGYPVRRFLQKDLFHSIIYYRHLGNEVFDDSFEVVLSDFHDPPNLSDPQIIVVVIKPVPDQPPAEAPGVIRKLFVKETEVIHLTKKQLHFIDLESPECELTYTVTTPPFFTSNFSIPKFTKDPDAPILRLFTQQAVNFMKVAYMPPIVDIGPYTQHIAFVLSVTNEKGKTVTGICFNITVFPVDDQAPEVFTNPLTVDEGADCWVSVDHLHVTDIDSSQENIRIEMKKRPQHGDILVDGTPMRPGQSFTVLDLNRLKVRYHHDSSETEYDATEFIATDGINTVDFILTIKVTLVNDEVPVMNSGLKPVLDCAEGQEVVVTIEYVCATDVDSEDNRLSYMIARHPYYGVIQRNGVIVDQFTQSDIIAGIITYKHTGEEIGLTPRNDTITFVISDGESDPSCCFNRPTSRLSHNLPVYDLKVTVFPVDTQAPSITIGDVFVVDEGGSASITVTHITATDMDTPLQKLDVILISPPQFGYIENVLPSPGFEKSNMGISVGLFSYRDVLNGNINYVQSRHHRIEPTADHFMVCMSDGLRRSPVVSFYIIINPTNDELPEILTKNITVQEGDSKELDRSIINAVDLDVPRDHLKFSLTRAPQHGSVIGSLYGDDRVRPRRVEQGEADLGIVVQAFTMEELKNGMSLLYVHDGTENMHDSFTIQLTDGKHIVENQVVIKVLPVNDEEPHITRNTGIEVDAGEARLISSAVLCAQDNDTPPQNILYIFQSVPSRGKLQVKAGLDWVELSAGMNCTQEMVDTNLLRYQHTAPPVDQSEDFFTFHLHDGKNQSPAQHFYISLKDLAKGDIALFVKPVKASRGERVVLTTDVLLAVDGTNKPEEMLYVVTVPPASGHMEYIKHVGVPVDSFSQLDIVANLVCYVHDNRGTSSKETMRFVVSNGKSTRNGTLEILVEMTDRILPLLVRNAGLRVPQGSTITLTTDSLSLSDPDTPPSTLVFSITKPPQYGQLTLKGVPLPSPGNFTQKHLQDLDVAYRHSGGSSQIDRFTFTASDSSGRGFLLDGKMQTEPVFFTIQIECLDSSAPQVVVQQTLWKVEHLKDGRYGIFISSRDLRAQDTESADEELNFKILQTPYYGYLENTATGEFVRHRFSQRDLSRRILLFIIDTTQDTSSDSLEFQVSDPLGNTGPSQTLEFSWSTVELEKTEYVTCESQGAITLTVLRRGNIKESTFVTVKVKDITASEGKDFIPPSSSLIQFDPGMSSRNWRVGITQDHLEEADEAFEVTLMSPVGSLLRGNTKAIVKIMDSDKGRCGLQTDTQGARLGGSKVHPGPYPKHGAITVESLPLDQVEGTLITRGDGLPQMVPQNKKKRLLVNGHRKVKPSSVHRNGSDIVYTYHGIMSMRVEDETTASSMDRRANVQVTSRGQYGTGTISSINLLSSSQKKNGPSSQNLEAPSPVPKACTPDLKGLLHLSEGSGQLYRCSGVSWKPWAPTHEIVSAQKCQQGWTHHSRYCYYLSTEKKATWNTAARTCRERFSGNLVSVPSKADMDWLWDFSGRKPFWIGLNDRESKGQWEWVGGEPVTFTNWRRSPPRIGKKDSRKCVLVWRRSKWQVQDCKTGKGHRYVCYRKS
ncbi:FRAS1-related extracellular matrix protein 1 isoform X2 [Denticeps clupeoides]|uniref:FRAS1-related extracellular matrix protein 1 isoform X2 n=1 Tax=Denticeps clupeoides TaxID=299321 RepID=UPI0010A2B4A5|nr:FRAS1-related extracellular matrix protein 1 isoform X2 [Denticeps clupeoides]